MGSGPLQAKKAQPQPRAGAKASAWLWPQTFLETEAIQRQTLARLKTLHAGQTERVEASPSAASPPLNWFWKRHSAAGQNKALSLRLLHEDLIWANRMLSREGRQENERGLRVAHYAAMRAGIALREVSLRAQIYQGWILPHLDKGALASTRDISRQRLVEAAYDAFRRDGQSENAHLCLRLLIRYADRQNTRDWARVKLAESLAAQGHYAQAVGHLERVQSPELAGSRALIPVWKQKASAATPTPLPNHTGH